MQKKWTVYVIKTESGKLYTGITTDLERRFSEHKESRHGAKFFHTDAPSKVVYTETCENRSQALKRENALKKMSHKEKMEVIESPVT